jgi:mannose-6-phosphate isomerase-like protein (cupin superfamily)
VHITEPHGFNVGAARQPPHCVNSQHNHQTAEVFVVHSGEWTFNFGEQGDEVRLPAGPGTVASIPTGIFRGFTNVGDEPGFLWVALGGDDPGHVQWAPYVFDLAEQHGLVLLADGSLVDTAKGEDVPSDAQPMKRTSSDEAARLHVPSIDEARGFAVTPEQAEQLPRGPLSADGVIEAAVLGPANPREKLPAGKLGWSHGFQLRRLAFAPGGRTRHHRRSEPEVLFVHQGSVDVHWPGGSLSLSPGDTLTVPIGLARQFESLSGGIMFAVHGSDSPAAPEWVD